LRLFFGRVNLVPLDEESGCELYGADDAAARSKPTGQQPKKKNERTNEEKRIESCFVFSLFIFFFYFGGGGKVLFLKLVERLTTFF
jgi:hypothetical protein